MAELFRRAYSLVIYRTTIPKAGEDYFVQKAKEPGGQTTNGIEITDLRVVFDIDRDLSKHPNRCDIKIYNLAKDSRTAMETKPLAVELYAGYGNELKLMFTGDVLFAMSKQEGPNWETMLQVGDGLRAFAKSRVNKSYKAGTTHKQVLKDIAKAMGETLPENIGQASDLDAPFASGMVVHGPARLELDRILSKYGYEWSFQNGHLQILKEEDSRNDTQVVSEETGMIGTPEFGDPPKSGKPPRLRIKSLLFPNLTPGGKVLVRSRTLNKLCKVVKVKHNGDSEGQDWVTEIEVTPTK